MSGDSIEDRKPDAYLLALTLHSAEHTAVVAWGWEAVGRNLYMAPGDVLVKAVPEVERLVGKRQPPKVYLGHRWQDRHDRPALEALVRAGGVVVVDR